MKRYLFLLCLLPSLSFADRLGSLTPNSNVLLSTQSAGGGASTLAIGTGTATSFTTNITSPTAVISALGDQFSLTTSGTTSFWQLNASSVTLLGQNVLTLSSAIATYQSIASSNSFIWNTPFRQVGSTVSADFVNALTSATIGGTLRVPGLTGLNGNSNGGLTGTALNLINNGTALVQNNTATANSHLQLGGGSGANSNVAIAPGNGARVVVASFTASSIFFSTQVILTQLSPGVAHLTDGTSSFATGLVSPSTEIAAGILPTTVVASSASAIMLVSSFPATGVTAGSYVNTNLTVDAYGRLTSASNGAGSSNGTIFAMTASSSVTNSSAETNVVGVGSGTITLPANYLQTGKTLRVLASGIYTSTTTAGTLTVKLKLGSTVIASTAAFSLVDNQISQLWRFGIAATVRSSGSSGTLFTNTAFQMYDTTNGMRTFPMVSTSAITLDMTTTQAIQLTAQFGTANSSNTFTTTNFVVVGETVTTVGGVSGGSSEVTGNLTRGIYLSAGSGLCQASSGCATSTQYQTSASSYNYVATIFQAGTTQYWNAGFVLPGNFYNSSTFTAQVVWASTMAVTASFKIDMAINEFNTTLDPSFGSAVSITTACASAGIFQSQESGAITASGTPAPNKYVTVRLYRNGDVTGDVRFLAIRLYYLTSQLAEH